MICQMSALIGMRLTEPTLRRKLLYSLTPSILCNWRCTRCLLMLALRRWVMHVMQSVCRSFCAKRGARCEGRGAEWGWGGGGGGFCWQREPQLPRRCSASQLAEFRGEQVCPGHPPKGALNALHGNPAKSIPEVHGRNVTEKRVSSSPDKTYPPPIRCVRVPFVLHFASCTSVFQVTVAHYAVICLFSYQTHCLSASVPWLHINNYSHPARNPS